MNFTTTTIAKLKNDPKILSTIDCLISKQNDHKFFGFSVSNLLDFSDLNAKNTKT